MNEKCYLCGTPCKWEWDEGGKSDSLVNTCDCPSEFDYYKTKCAIMTDIVSAVLLEIQKDDYELPLGSVILSENSHKRLKSLFLEEMMEHRIKARLMPAKEV